MRQPGRRALSQRSNELIAALLAAASREGFEERLIRFAGAIPFDAVATKHAQLGAGVESGDKGFGDGGLADARLSGHEE